MLIRNLVPNPIWILAWLILGLYIFILIDKVKHLENSETSFESQLKYAGNFENKGLKVDVRNPVLSTDDDVLVIYNRIPKTGSTSFINVAYDLCYRNKFNVLHLNITGNAHVMSLADQVRFVRNVTKWNAKKPAIYHGHVGFINFQRLGTSQIPIYINLLRKPLDRLVSYYYFLRHGDDFRPHLIRRKHGDTMTFDECVERQKPDCDFNNMWLQVPFLCGQAAECWVPGSMWALEQAKRNLAEHYLVVGVMEELTDFISILETALPRFFRGATSHFLSSKKAHLRKTMKKLDPSEETIKRVESSSIWQLENELYQFALQQFHFLKKRMNMNSDNILSDRGAKIFKRSKRGTWSGSFTVDTC